MSVIRIFIGFSLIGLSFASTPDPEFNKCGFTDGNPTYYDPFVYDYQLCPKSVMLCSEIGLTARKNCVVCCLDKNNSPDFAMTKADQGTKTTAPDTKTADAGKTDVASKINHPESSKKKSGKKHPWLAAVIPVGLGILFFTLMTVIILLRKTNTNRSEEADPLQNIIPYSPELVRERNETTAEPVHTENHQLQGPIQETGEGKVEEEKTCKNPEELHLQTPIPETRQDNVGLMLHPCDTSLLCENRKEFEQSI